MSCSLIPPKSSPISCGFLGLSNEYYTSLIVCVESSAIKVRCDHLTRQVGWSAEIIIDVVDGSRSLTFLLQNLAHRSSRLTLFVTALLLEALRPKSEIISVFKFRRTELNPLVLERPSSDRRIPNRTRRPARHSQPNEVPCPAQRGKFSQTNQEERRVEDGRRT
jgi:hypothetical protein